MPGLTLLTLCGFLVTFYNGICFYQACLDYRDYKYSNSAWDRVCQTKRRAWVSLVLTAILLAATLISYHVQP